MCARTSFLFGLVKCLFWFYMQQLPLPPPPSVLCREYTSFFLDKECSISQTADSGPRQLAVPVAPEFLSPARCLDT